MQPNRLISAPRSSSCNACGCERNDESGEEVALGAAEERKSEADCERKGESEDEHVADISDVGATEVLESEAGGELSSFAVKQVDQLLSLVNLDSATPKGAAIFWSKALSHFAQLAVVLGQPDSEFLPWTADRLLAMIEDDGHVEHLLTRPEILLFFQSIKKAGFSDGDIISVWENIIYPKTPMSRAWDAPHAHSFANEMESMLINRSAPGRPMFPADASVTFITGVE